MRIAGIPLAVFLPLASMAFVVLWGGGLGFSFILLNKTGLKEWGAVIVGVSLIVLVPAVAALAVRRLTGSEQEEDS